MSLITDTLEKNLEDKMQEILKDFVCEDDFIHDSWRSEKCFDYRKCIKRVVALLKDLKAAEHDYMYSK